MQNPLTPARNVWHAWPASRSSAVRGRTLNCRARADSRERGVALLIAVVIILTLSGLAMAMVLLTDSQIRLGQTTQAQGRAFYASLGGIEEARGRMNGSAADTIAPALPATISQVLYIVNSTTSDPVQPTNPASPYYDFEYASEFPAGFTSATILPNIPSDQPGAGTSTTIPYKWVRITLMTEASAHTDINQDGVFNSTSPIYWDGTQQTFTSTNNTYVYVLTALAVDSTQVRKILQTEVAGTPGGASFTPLAPLATAGSVSVTGNGGSPNITIDGNDHNPGGPGCPAPAAALPGIVSGGAATISSATVTGNPPTQPNVAPFPQSVASLISQFQTSATIITSVDPAHVTSNGTSYTATNTSLGIQPSEGNSGTVSVVYADKPLTISGTSSGYGVLLVNGNLTVHGDFNYQGVIMVNGQINVVSHYAPTKIISGSILASGNITLDASLASGSSTITTQYNSCTISQVLESVSGGTSGLVFSTTPPQILSYHELSY